MRELTQAIAAGEVETADVVFGWLPRLAHNSMKKQMAKQHLAKRGTCVLDAKEMTELTFPHRCMSHANVRMIGRCVQMANIPIKGTKENHLPPMHGK